VPFGDAPAIAREVIGLLRDDTRRHAMRKNAYRMGREMIWSNVAQLYMRSFELSRLQGAALSRKSLVTKTLDQRPRELPELKLDHLSRMTDSTGVFQHAIFGVRIFPRAIAPTTMRVHLSSPCCWANWERSPNGRGAWPPLAPRFCITRSTPKPSASTTT
jgi:hypothetical protein